MLPEPHSSKQREDCVDWALSATALTMLAYRSQPPAARHDRTTAQAICRSVRCPVLVICGDEDMCQPPERGRRVAELTGAEFVVIEGAGHLPQARDPVKDAGALHPDPAQRAEAAQPSVQVGEPNRRRRKRLDAEHPAVRFSAADVNVQMGVHPTSDYLGLYDGHGHPFSLRVGLGWHARPGKETVTIRLRPTGRSIILRNGCAPSPPRELAGRHLTVLDAHTVRPQARGP